MGRHADVGLSGDRNMSNKLPEMKDEPNQAEIDAETARRLREAAQEQRDKKK